nr:M15 family metallopeptidase [uncultured Psychrobacter sp.]
MIYLLAAFFIMLSILIIIMLFDRQLLARLFAYTTLVSHRLPKVDIKKSIPKKRESLKRRLDTTSIAIPVVPMLSLFAIIATLGMCYFLITHNSLAVYHAQITPVSTASSQINQLLVGERLSPPPAPPEELFAELEAEIASYQASQMDEGYWPDAPNNPVTTTRPLMLPEPDLSDLNTQDTATGYSGDVLASHIHNDQINIKNADRNWEKMNSEFVQRLLTVYKVMRDQYGYEMVLLEGYRSPKRQARLLNKGAHVTNAGAYKSYHQFGLAGDSAFIRNGKIVITEKDPWAMQGYKLYGKVAKSAGLVWGGDWRMMDLGHVELRKKGVLGRPDMAEILTSQ